MAQFMLECFKINPSSLGSHKNVNLLRDLENETGGLGAFTELFPQFKGQTRRFVEVDIPVKEKTDQVFHGYVREKIIKLPESQKVDGVKPSQCAHG